MPGVHLRRLDDRRRRRDEPAEALGWLERRERPAGRIAADDEAQRVQAGAHERRVEVGGERGEAPLVDRGAQVEEVASAGCTARRRRSAARRARRAGPRAAPRTRTAAVRARAQPRALLDLVDERARRREPRRQKRGEVAAARGGVRAQPGRRHERDGAAGGGQRARRQALVGVADRDRRRAAARARRASGPCRARSRPAAGRRAGERTRRRGRSATSARPTR